MIFTLFLHNRLTWKVILIFFFYFLLFSFGIENWSEGIEIFISPPTQLSFSLQLPYKCVVAARSLAGLPLPGAASLAFGLLRPKPPPPLSLSLSPARSLTSRDRPSRRSTSVSVVGHPPPGHPSPAFYFFGGFGGGSVSIGALSLCIEGKFFSLPLLTRLCLSSPAGGLSFSTRPHLSPLVRSSPAVRSLSLSLSSRPSPTPSPLASETKPDGTKVRFF
jgi:hypothetical protein